METKRFKIVKAQSNIDWVGRKVTGAHNGTISIKEGEIVLKDGKLASGRFVVDTSSIKILDITDPVTNAQFAGHLASDDFFSTDKHPEAIFEIVSVSGLFVVGDLTIKGISHPAALNVAVDVNGDLLTATGKLVIDRTDYGMKFRSGNFFKDLGDNLIYNDFELNVNITAKMA
jgi:polyisoprenoid-binding protein YceI